MKVDEYPIPCKDAERLALLTSFAITMKEKLDIKDKKYPPKPADENTLNELLDHFKKEVSELLKARRDLAQADTQQYASSYIMRLNRLESECIDVANMAFFIREECIRRVNKVVK